MRRGRHVIYGVRMRACGGREIIFANESSHKYKRGLMKIQSEEGD
jgi:hypothetical protein